MSGRLDRRRFLQGVAVAGAAAPALAACSHSVDKNSAASNTKVVLPAYLPYGGVRPDLAGDKAGLESGYLRYPAKPVEAVSAPPGSGGSVSAFTIVYAAVPPPVSRNKYWKALNTALGVDLKIQLTPSVDYQNKFATLTAGGDVPDFVQVAGQQARLPQLLAAEFQDLSHWLSGDAVKAYPFLANLPTDSWRATVFNGGIYGLPVPRAAVGPIMLRRDDILTRKSLDGNPHSFAEFAKLCTSLTDAKHSKWAMCFPGGALIFAQEMLGVPNGWRVTDGKFTSALELPETKQAVGAVQGLVRAGVFHPDSFSTTINTKDLFGGGTVAVHYDNYTSWGAYLRDYAKVNPTIDIGGMLPPGYDGGTKAVLWEGAPSYSLTAVRKGSKTRIEELLRIANWLSAPFGTKEYLLRKYGVANVDYTVHESDPVLTDEGESEVANFTATYIADAPQVLYEPGKPAVTSKEYAYQKRAIPITVGAPTLGLFSDTDASKGGQLATAITDAQHVIWQGHKPLSSWDDAVATWRSSGGDQIRKEYEQSYEKAH